MTAKIKRPRRIRPEEAMDARRELQGMFQQLRDARTNPDFYDGRRVVYELLGATQYSLIAALAFLDAGPTGKDWYVRDLELRQELVVADTVRMERQKAAKAERMAKLEADRVEARA